MANGITRKQIVARLKAKGFKVRKGSLHSILRASGTLQSAEFVPVKNYPHIQKQIFPPDTIDRVVVFLTEEKNRRSAMGA